MPRPILTDDIVDEARQKREQLEEDIRRGIKENPVISAKYDKEAKQLKKQAVYKSRRIENAKTKARGNKLNLYLVIAILILLALIFWILSPWS